jgi:cell division protein FtsZ
MLFEVDEAVNRIRAEVDPDANILFGSALSETMEGRVRVSVVATGIDSEAIARGVSSKVQLLHPRGRQAANAAEVMAATGTDAVARYDAPSPVHRQVETLALGLNDMLEPEAVERAEAPAAAQPAGFDGSAIAERILPVQQAPSRAPLAQFGPKKPEKRGLGGLFGRRREAKPQEPAPQRTAAPTPPQAPLRAEQEMRAQPEPQKAPPEDLFAGHQENDPFEIPAFLRRQVNSSN